MSTQKSSHRKWAALVIYPAGFTQYFKHPLSTRQRQQHDTHIFININILSVERVRKLLSFPFYFANL